MFLKFIILKLEDYKSDSRFIYINDWNNLEVWQVSLTAQSSLSFRASYLLLSCILGGEGSVPLAALPFSLTEVVTVEDVCLVAEDALGFVWVKPIVLTSSGPLGLIGSTKVALPQKVKIFTTESRVASVAQRLLFSVCLDKLCNTEEEQWHMEREIPLVGSKLLQ